MSSHLKNIAKCLTITASTLQMLSDSFTDPVLMAITNTTQSLLKHVQTIKQNQDDCNQLLEQTQQLLDAIIVLHIKSDADRDFTPDILKHLGKFTGTLQKINTFVESQQNSSKVRKFFHRGEMSTLLKECKSGLQESLDVFQVDTISLMSDINKIQQDTEQRHQDVLNMIETYSDRSSISGIYSGSFTSSNSISMLPSEPQIFHGRESELTAILTQFNQTAPRIAILGPGGMGKSSLAKVLLHHRAIAAKYGEHRFFVSCDSVTSKVELASIIGTHIGLKPGKDLTQAVIQQFSQNPPSLLVIDNLETVWEPGQLRKEIEEFLSLLTGIYHLALIITMRGAERPARVQWTHPFVPPLKSLEPDAAKKMFIDIADDHHDTVEIDQILLLADNMPLAISLLASLADVEGCSNILSHWEEEKTTMISVGYDRRSNLDLSISISLSSPRITSEPESLLLLGLLSILPDGLSEVELTQSRFLIKDISRCRITLLRASLAYIDGHKRLKVLVPIREHMQKSQPSAPHMVHSLLNYFHDLLDSYMVNKSPQVIARISSNYSNIQNILRNGLQPGHPDLKSCIYGTCHLNSFSRDIGHGAISLMDQVHDSSPHSCGPQPVVYYITELFNSSAYRAIPNAEILTAEALEHFGHFSDPDLQCRFYISQAIHHMRSQAISKAIICCQNSLSLAISAGNTGKKSDALRYLAWIKWHVGDYSAAQTDAYESQRCARISGASYLEAQALAIEAACLLMQGNYKQTIAVCNRARHLIALCGTSGANLDHEVMMVQAAAHSMKSEYTKAATIFRQILQGTSAEKDPIHHAAALVNLCGSEVPLQHEIENKSALAKAKAICCTLGDTRLIESCDAMQAYITLKEGNMLAASTLLQNSLKISWGKQAEIASNCLEKLGDASYWGPSDFNPIWTTIFLAHSVQTKQKLRVHKALQFLGDIFLGQRDEVTAITLFTVALDGFTYMDVHRSRAECMLRLGDIS
ncbi:hypothetical protein DFH06DRAFT_1067886, partial [Mycena polygramma]